MARMATTTKNDEMAESRRVEARAAARVAESAGREPSFEAEREADRLS
jgi:hypothetical protein